MKRFALFLILVLVCSTPTWANQIGMCYTGAQMSVFHWTSWNLHVAPFPSFCSNWSYCHNWTPCPTPNPCPNPNPCPQPSPCWSWVCGPGNSIQTVTIIGGGNSTSTSTSTSNSTSYSY